MCNIFRFLKKTIGICLIGIGIGILLVLLLPVAGWTVIVSSAVIILGLIWFTA